MAHYAQDVLIFDVKPPFQIKSADAFRRIWEECFLDFSDSFEIESRDLSITVSGADSDRSLGFSLHRDGKRPPSGADVDAEHR